MPVELEQFVDRIYRFALSLTNDQHAAEDLTQDALAKACAKLHQLQTADKAKSWLFQITANLWKDSLKKSTMQRDSSRPLADLVARSADPATISLQKEQHTRILKAMQELPQQQRTVLFLNAVEGFTHQEIADILQKTPNAVKANLSVARKTMRKQLLAESDNHLSNQQVTHRG